MKALFLFLTLSLCTLNLNATIRTVNNTGSAQFTTIQAAVNACVSGDTIYVHGSSGNYAGFTITNKKLVVIGPGYAPVKQFGFPATINTTVTITGSLCSGTEINGFSFLSATLVINSASPDTIQIIRNQFLTCQLNINEGNKTYSSYLWEGNAFFNSSINANTSSTYKNFIFQNNLAFSNNGSTMAGGFFNSINVLWNHNLFYGHNAAVYDCFTNNCIAMFLTNNVFVRRNAANSTSQCAFANNITFNAGNNTPWASNGNADSGGNVAGQDPLMVDQVSVNNGVYNPLLNFTIASGPANNSGTDAKDMGLLYDTSGSLNWTNSRVTRLPYVYSMNITNSSIPINGTLNVNVEARKNN